MRRKIIIMSFLCVFLMVAMLAAGTSSGPPDGRTGAPGETNCTVGCHNSYDLNSGDGSMSIDNVPSQYNPEQTYTLTVTLQDPGQERWGFEITVLDGSNNMAGSLSVSDSTSTQLSSTSGRQYIKQTTAGTFDGTSDGPVSWSFNWLAPEPGTGTITFYAAGNAANSGSGNKLDYIYTTTASSDEPGGGTGNQIPICSVSSPSTGDKVSGTITISGTSSDSDGTVESVEVRIDSGSWIEADGTTSWTYELDTKGLTNGAHKLHARSYDGTDHSHEVSVNIEVDNQVEIDNGNGDTDSSMLILLIVIVIIVVVIIVAVLMRRR